MTPAQAKLLTAAKIRLQADRVCDSSRGLDEKMFKLAEEGRRCANLELRAAIAAVDAEVVEPVGHYAALGAMADALPIDEQFSDEVSAMVTRMQNERGSSKPIPTDPPPHALLEVAKRWKVADAKLSAFLDKFSQATPEEDAAFDELQDARDALCEAIAVAEAKSIEAVLDTAPVSQFQAGCDEEIALNLATYLRERGMEAPAMINREVLLAHAEWLETLADRATVYAALANAVKKSS